MEIRSNFLKPAAAKPVYSPISKQVSNDEAADDKKCDKFIKSVDDYLRNERRRQKQEEKIARQNAIDAAVRKRRRAKLFLKKHSDYLRFLRGTALKRSIEERKRISDPNADESEITCKSDTAADAKMPIFVRVR